MKRTQRMEQTRWDLALRYRLIETVVWWEGRLTTNHLMQSFGISRQQASKDINTYINDYASKNLVYDKQIKGYVPTRQFKPLFIDDSASAYLDLLNQNNERAPHIEGLALAYAHTEVLKVPDRSVKPEVLRPLLKRTEAVNSADSMRRDGTYSPVPRMRSGIGRGRAWSMEATQEIDASSLFEPGDQVRFERIDRGGFDELARQEGTE